MTNNDLKNKLSDIIELLSVKGVGRGRYHRLVKNFGSVDNILRMGRSELTRVSGISETIATDIVDNRDHQGAVEAASKIIQLGWTTLFSDCIEFPKQLLNIPQNDIPPILFLQGDKEILNETMIAIVGARNATEKGRRFAFELGYSLGKAGITVVSGMADGIDSAAHKGALKAGGKTVAVWGNSIDIVYPPTNKLLAEEIKSSGVVISEYLPGTKPDRANFPQRNRIISGLSEAVVVIEAGKKSGALLTASQALLQERTLFAVPGSPGDRMSEGCNLLLKKGACLLTSIDDIYEGLPRLKGEVIAKPFVKLPEVTGTEKEIIDLFFDGPQQLDYISRTIKLPVPELMEFILALELKGIVREISGKRYELAENY